MKHIFTHLAFEILFNSEMTIYKTYLLSETKKEKVTFVLVKEYIIKIKYLKSFLWNIVIQIKEIVTHSYKNI